MKRVAAYCRVSTDHEDQINSFDSQQRYFMDYIHRNPDWVLEGVYADEGLSGTSTNKRVQFNRMIESARKGNLDLIITKEVSRFARNTVDTLAYTRELRRLGVGVIFLLDNINTMEQDGELRLTLMSSIAQEESRKTSERVKWGQTRQMEQGVVFGSSLLGYDVKNGRIEINQQGAEIVKRIFHQYLYERKGSYTIARELNSDCIPSSRGNYNWSASTILKILKNEKYCGDLIQKKTYTTDFLSHKKKINRGEVPQVILRNHHTPIISRTEWEQVQKEILRRSGTVHTSGRGTFYPLSGKLKCGLCGSPMLARKKYTSYGTYIVWRCSNAVLHGATACQLRRQLRNETALDILKQTIQKLQIDESSILLDLLCSIKDNRQDSRSYTERNIRLIKARADRVLNAFLNGLITQEKFSAIQTECEQTLNQLQRKLTQLPEERDILNSIRNLLHSDDELFYSTLLDQMTLFPDGTVKVSLNGVRTLWRFQIQSKAVHYNVSVPISVNNPLASGNGME